MVDTLALGASGSNPMRVRVSPTAQEKNIPSKGIFLLKKTGQKKSPSLGDFLSLLYALFLHPPGVCTRERSGNITKKNLAVKRSNITLSTIRKENITEAGI